MKPTAARRWVAAAATVALIAGTGGALAARGDGSTPANRDALLGDVAKRLGVEKAALVSAFKAAATARVDAALAAGTITAEKAARVKARIAAGKGPLRAAAHRPGLGPRGHHRPPHAQSGGRKVHGPVAAAAKFLGLTPRQLLTQLRDGRSLADVARANGKSVDALKQAILTAMTTELKQHVDALVDRSPAFGRRP